MIKKIYNELTIAIFRYNTKSCIATSGPYGDAIDGFNGENYKLDF